MQVTLPARSEQERQLHAIDPRRDARKVVGLRATIADKLGLASGEVTNISPGGCGLRLTKLLRRDQYITLKVYLDEGPAIQIDLGKVQWVEEERAGVEFLYLSQQHTLALYRLCAEQVELPLGT